MSQPVEPLIVVVGAGPAGLMAAETCVDAGAQVAVFDAMPSVGRKFLLAGKGGLNLTHSEPADAFGSRYGQRRPQLQPMIDSFGPAALRDWAHGLGVDTFVGTSGRVFPREMKAAPMLRAWLRRLREAGVVFHSRCRWDGSLAAGESPPHGAAPPRSSHARAGAPGAADLSPPVGKARNARGAAASPPGAADGRAWRIGFVRTSPAAAADRGTEASAAQTELLEHRADAVILALGGGSWPRLGSDGAWVPWLSERGVPVAPLEPANCGFDCGWSDHFSSRWAGAPVKSAAIALCGPGNGYGTDDDAATGPAMLRGEFVVTATGVEGSLVYRLAAAARDRIAAGGDATLLVDLLPDRREPWIRQRLERPRGALSFVNHLRRNIGLDGVKSALLRECVPDVIGAAPQALAASIKRLPLKLRKPRPLSEAISTAGGVRFEALDQRLMCLALPGVFCAGEMLDWEAPTGGYLLTACFATGRAAARGALDWLHRLDVDPSGPDVPAA